MVFAGVRLAGGHDELTQIITELERSGFDVQDLSGDETAKLHVRYMVGGRPPQSLPERLFSVEFPERPGALLQFLSALQQSWNISLFHYRNHGAAVGQVLVGFEVPDSEQPTFEACLTQLGFAWREITDSPAYRLFLTR